MNTAQSKNQIRQTMRARRKRLSPQQLNFAELGAATQARQSSQLLQAKRILSYAPFAGEISPAKTVEKLTVASIYLPRITNFRTRSMRFFSADTLESLNKYGIVEPAAIGTPAPANSFDVILVPLVAFDRAGTRVGMGAGYYDRALAALLHQTSTRPFLIGLAHHFQEVKSLPREPWDVPLDAILTDQEFILT